jgi:hypothetical protein
MSSWKKKQRTWRAAQRLCALFGCWPPLPPHTRHPFKRIGGWKDEVLGLLRPEDDAEAVGEQFDKFVEQMTMTKYLACFKFLGEYIARYKCRDCGVNVIEAGDYCLLNDDIWKRQLRLRWKDNLCIECIEKRLGRKLKFIDFNPSATVEKSKRKRRAPALAMEILTEVKKLGTP